MMNGDMKCYLAIFLQAIVTATSVTEQSLPPELVKKKKKRLQESKSPLAPLKKNNHLAESERPGSAVKQVALVPLSM